MVLSMSRRLEKRLRAETGAIEKNPAGKLRVALAYPNRYYLGMSNVGFQGVYRFWNEQPDVYCERVFLPDGAELAQMRRERAPLVSLETQTPVHQFDVIAFSITFEPDELNLLRMLDLAGIEPLAAERSAHDPLVLAGGPVTFLNPEPLAPFLDVIAIGEAEVLLPTLTDKLASGLARPELLETLFREEGFYVPSLVEVSYHADGRIAGRRFKDSAGSPSGGQTLGNKKLVRAKMGKRASVPPPATYVLTPDTEMSDKFLVEVSRGCPTLCRFCWAGYNYLPKRSFEIEKILVEARRARAWTGDIGLVSTAVGAHREIVPLLKALKELDFRISVSSLRFEDLRPELVDPLVQSGERTLAVAPEVGTDRLRFAIHKRVTNEEILSKVDMLFERGVENLKLYLMVGLPGEREEDVEGILSLVATIRDRLLEHGQRRGRAGRVIPSVNPFVPKPGTPFQWYPMAPHKELAGKMRYLQKHFSKMSNVEAHCKSPRHERLQALLALGDRRLAPAMLSLAREQTDLRTALDRLELSLDFYIYRHRSRDELLPWDIIDNGMKPELLENQYDKAVEAMRDHRGEPAIAVPVQP